MTPVATTGHYPLRSETRALLKVAGLDPDDVLHVIERAAVEDLGAIGDVTSAATVSPDATMAGSYVTRQAGVVAGLPVLVAVFEHCLGDDATVELLSRDGERVQPGQAIARVEAPAVGLLATERLSLNLLGHLSGIATLTRAWVDAIAGTAARIRDTRKTTPGLRDLEKYAVRCGGGVNHRRGLDDGVLIKDNHVAAAGGVGQALDRVHQAYPATAMPVQVEVEVDDLAQLEEALAHGAREVLLDNFDDAALRTAVTLVRQRQPEVVIEASGGLTLDRAAAVARTGVDYLAVGALTHSAPILDIGLDTETG
ncbi:MAG TPA: carboxylating nicotinate-nucleotide diphosphorylase [Mycobacteriales bacterium]|nr:carboxylating nicotinate-nucleotide diphosphorylase [Mycobacteriales bacterium]